MKREVHRVVRTLLAAAVLLGASFGLAALETGEAFAYSYRTTDTKTIYNRAWIRADASANYLELIGSDPIGPRFDMPSWNAPAASILASRRIGSPYGAPRTVRTTLSGILCRELQELSILIFRIIRSPPENIMFMYIIGIRHRIYARPNSESRVILLLR